MKSKILDVVLFVPSLDGGVGRVTYLLAKGLYENGKKGEFTLPWAKSFRRKCLAE